MSREAMKYTPGPWTVQYDQGNPYVSADQGKQWNNPVVCSLYEDVTPSDSVTVGPWLEANENAEANARLIAAAPDLLEALKWLTVCVKRHGPHMDAGAALEKADAAIAKATGEKA